MANIIVFSVIRLKICESNTNTNCYNVIYLFIYLFAEFRKETETFCSCRQKKRAATPACSSAEQQEPEHFSTRLHEIYCQNKGAVLQRAICAVKAPLVSLPAKKRPRESTDGRVRTQQHNASDEISRCFAPSY